MLQGVRGVLLDVDGTLLDGDAAIPGAAETLQRLRRAGLGLRLITNTTRRSRAAVAAALRRAGIDADEQDVLTPAALARSRIAESDRSSALLLIPREARRDFAGVVTEGSRSAWVVVGDMGNEFTWDLLNQAFRVLFEGARLLALQKNRYWLAGDAGLQIDAGAIVAALEYAAGVEAELVGKPSPEFFRLALAELGLPANEVLMIGDDLVNDGQGGQSAGCRTAIVRTGKFRQRDLDGGPFRPDLLLRSVAELGN